MSKAIELIKKYNVPVPRYTSYPTVPYWNNYPPEEVVWQNALLKTYAQTNKTEGISLYMHLPFCESLCTYCGCNKRITKNHGVEPVYMQAILKEWSMYLELLNEKPLIREIHLGGGTPTFFSPENLESMLTKLLSQADVHPDYKFSFEGHPNNTTEEHLLTLYKLGFTRVSFGVQDLSEKVQKAINRVQPFENVKFVTEKAREIGYTSVNFDLIYGLPFQTETSLRETFEQVIQLQPDRIAFYSYAHVPWAHKAQRGYSEADLPTDDVKLNLYETGKQLLMQNGYLDVGMDHFAKPEDELNIASKAGKLHRNFMGYTTSNSKILIGLGVSAISDIYEGYAQNVKTVEEYYAQLKLQRIPFLKGYFLTDEDKAMRQYILDIACRNKTEVTENVLLEIKPKLKELEKDGLVQVNNLTIQVTEKGRNFIRNICSVFDLKLQSLTEQQSEKMFSKAV